MKLVRKLISGPPGAAALRAAGLDHEVGDDAVELETVVEPLTGQFFKVGYGLGNFVPIKLGLDGPFVRFNRNDFHSCSPGVTGSGGVFADVDN